MDITPDTPQDTKSTEAVVVAGLLGLFGGAYVASKGFSAVATTTDIGMRVREARKVMKLSQQAFSDLAGVGRRFVSELEAGKPTLEFERVLKVCHAAGIDLFTSQRSIISRETA